MKIGIFTYHRALNYGAVLQAYALSRVLSDQGHDVKVIDYWSSQHSSFYSISPFSVFLKRNLTLAKKIKLFLLIIISFPIKYLRKKKFAFFLKKKFAISGSPKYVQGINILDNCDLYIYGSDQIWWYDDFLSFD